MVPTTSTKKAAAKPPAKKTTTARKPAVAKKAAAKKTTPKKKAAEAGATSSAAARGGKAAGAGSGPAPASPTFQADYPVADMKPHPRNPRHHTVADDDMVASIKEQGLLEPVILAPDGTVIAGNRRLDGLKKAKKKTAPALIRHDLDTPEKQLEAALVENCHRENLTAIEEAEAYALFQEMGYTQAKIATKVGRPVATVRDRLKLLKLDKSAQDKIHDGQLTIAHALDLVSFDDDPKTQKKLAKAAIDGSNFEYQLRQEKERRTARLKVERHVEELTGLGVTTVIDVPVDSYGGSSYYTLEQKTEDLRHLGTYGTGYSGLNDPLATFAKKLHKGCLAYSVEDDRYNGRVLRLWCTKDSGHQDERTAETAVETKAEADRRAQWEREQAQREADAVAAKISKDLRTTAVMSSIGPGLKLDAQVTNVLRTLLPHLLCIVQTYRGLDDYFDLAGIPEEKRWKEPAWNAKDEDYANAIAFTEDLGAATPYTLVHSLFALLLNTIEYADLDNPLERLAIRRYYELLTEGLGHQLTEVDQAVLTQAQEPADDPEIDPYDFVHGKGNLEPGVETPCGLTATVGKSLHTHVDIDHVTCPNCIDVLDVA